MNLKCLLIALMSTTVFVALAHEDTTLSVLKTSSVENRYSLSPSMHLFVDSNNNTELQTLTGSKFLHLNEIPNRKIRKDLLIDSKIYLLFWIFNNEDKTRSFYITPGTYAKEVVLYYRDSTKADWTLIPNQNVSINNENAYRLFSILPGKEIQLMVQCRFARTNVSFLNPFLINTLFFNYHLSEINTNWYGVNIFTYILSGLLLMMMLFAAANYVQNFKREFLYYSIYALSMGILIFFKALQYKRSTGFNFFYEEYLDYFLQISGYVFYIGFTRMLLNTPQKYKILNKIFIASEIILGVFLLVFSILYFAGASYKFLSFTENSSKFFMIFLGLVYLFIGVVYRNRLMNYLLGGNIANLLMGLISQYLIIYPSTKLVPATGMFRQSLIYFEIGILLELILFLLALTYKNKVELIEKVKMDEALKLEDEKKDYEKKIAVLSAQQDERSRISADMHDELGSGVTAIRLLSEIAMKKTQEAPVTEIVKISNNANELMTKMNAIIWSMNPANDTLTNLIAYIRSYSSNYLETFDIKYQIKVDEPIPATEISGTKRRNMFLVLKESLNNLVKHAQASEVKINIHFNHQLIIEIADNGKGINTEKLNQFGNGLNNMKNRMTSIGGTFQIASNNGTIITLEIPI